MFLAYSIFLVWSRLNAAPKLVRAGRRTGLPVYTGFVPGGAGRSFMGVSKGDPGRYT